MSGLACAPLDDAPRLDQLAAAQLAGFIGFLQGGLDRLVVAARAAMVIAALSGMRPLPTAISRRSSPFLSRYRMPWTYSEAQAGLLGDDFLS
jgi:hypothetical protein